MYVGKSINFHFWSILYLPIVLDELETVLLRKFEMKTFWIWISACIGGCKCETELNVQLYVSFIISIVTSSLCALFLLFSITERN